MSNEDNEEDRDEEYEIISNYDYACRAFKDKKISFEEMKEAIKKYCQNMINFINKKE